MLKFKHQPSAAALRSSPRFRAGGSTGARVLSALHVTDANGMRAGSVASSGTEKKRQDSSLVSVSRSRGAKQTVAAQQLARELEDDGNAVDDEEKKSAGPVPSKAKQKSAAAGAPIPGAIPPQPPQKPLLSTDIDPNAVAPAALGAGAAEDNDEKLVEVQKQSIQLGGLKKGKYVSRK